MAGRPQANQYSTEFMLAACAPSAGVGIDFGFGASYVRIANYASVPIHFTLAGTSAASTNDPELRPGATIELAGLNVWGCGVSTTSTTTSTGGDGHRVQVTALGGA